MISPILIELGPLTIRWYAICIVVGLILGVYLAIKAAPSKKITADDVLDLILLAFPLSILGARVYYVIFSWSYYKDHLAEIPAIWNGGIAIYGGILTGIACVYWFTRRRFINTLDFLDLIAPSLILAQSIGRWGNFFNQEAYGQAVANLNYLPTFIRQQMYIDGDYRTPTFLYESLWNLLGFIVMMGASRRKDFLKRGDFTAFYLIWYGVGRFIIEGMRTDSLMWLSIRVSQWLSLILVILGLGLLLVGRGQKDKVAYHL
ncbi:prolipoprotein diacylglyceryl transferase [Streptococcus cuniculipharyngis]|uniref:Phosphatidylglycerol--prolipoprotein diacylglyceryl transferase n=1 Tax=Streptococcus cuniculipharyngis TaxID=1562651 RepID=A0A5C5SDW6_9STRE|nr:prolipoprotein diacylglyceryl transferase [Streptococcus cuniculipharyngis]TWS98065.1 prolipoprotein diacylglyceryl transferase [Streptococcus cuniculipharyngis]